MFNAELYTVSIRLENIEGDDYYVARVKELPDVEDYGDTYAEARSLVIETIETAYKECKEQEIPFPEPYEFKDHQESSGRITLRLPKSLHSSLISEAEDECVSLNQLLVAKLSHQQGKCEITSNLKGLLAQQFSNLETTIVEVNSENNMAVEAILNKNFYEPTPDNNWNIKPSLKIVM